MLIWDGHTLYCWQKPVYVFACSCDYHAATGAFSMITGDFYALLC